MDAAAGEARKSGAVWDGNRANLPAPVPQGGTATVALLVDAPAAPGPLVLVIDLVHEGTAWFSERGVAPLERPVAVVARPSIPPAAPSPARPNP